MSTQDNGGPAFPRDHACDGHNGMTLRDYFAAKAMAALISEPPWMENSRPVVAVFDDRDEQSQGPEQFAYVAYRIADAMLKARQQ